MKRTLVVALALLLSGCASVPQLSEPTTYTSDPCGSSFSKTREAETETQLDMTSELFRSGCYNEVIHLATYIREQRRDKFYSLTAEMAEVFTPEGTFTPYVLESYERSFLSLLISLSYLHLHQEDAARAELRRSLEEENALIYNYGNDPILTLLQAALWDRFDPTMARPLWKSVSEFSNQDQNIKNFALNRIQAIDSQPLKPMHWRIYGYGEMPDLDWSSAANLKKGPYEIRARSAFPASCSSNGSVLVPTEPWIAKIGTKYHSSYHPLLYAKSLARLPFGLAYGIVGISTGIAVGGAGCVIATQAKDAAAEICGASLQAAGYVIGKSGDLVSYTLAPDLRRWKKLPMAFYVTNEAESEPQASRCLASASDAPGRTTFTE